MANLESLDWIVLIFFMALFVFIGIRFRGKAGSSLNDFFLGGRNLPWYVAGVSMVATTFAADTPLWVTEKIAQHGISGNWLWWNMLIGGMLTTFFFARLWRRAEILTELELLELRYSGPVARLLRGVKSVYLGLFMNCIIIGWVNAALISILEVFFEIPYSTAFWFVAGAMLLVAIYSSIAGLLGIAITDFFQFIIAMVGCIVLAVIVLDTPEIGGIEGLKSKLPAWRLDFSPKLSDSSDVLVGTFSLSAGAFFSYLALQWWASWYPGAEPGGGGYISQRMMSAKNERHAVYSSLFFQIAHYCLRPWPWIIVGLCALVLYPDLPVEESRKGFIMAMRDFLPVGIKGLLLVGFFSAYMSTISTQLNWGASYLTNDLYKRFIKPEDKFKRGTAEKAYVFAGRVFTIIIMVVGLIVTTQITTIDSAAQFLISSGAGLGLVLILRWYWWRINAWSELVATLAPFIGLPIAVYILPDYLPQEFFNNNGVFIFTVVFTTIAWIIATFITKPIDNETLLTFYDRVRPSGIWGKFQLPGSPSSDIKYLFISWASGVVMVYSILFLIGNLIFKDWTPVAQWSLSLVASFLVLRWAMNRAQF